MKTVLIGGGQGCLAVLEMLDQGSLEFLVLEILAVVDVDPDAPAMHHARARGWKTLTSIPEGMRQPGLELAIELTGEPRVVEEIEEHLPMGVRVMDHVMARVFWDLESVTKTLRRELDQRTRDRAELQEFADRFGQIIDAVKGIVTIKDLEGRYQLVNPRAEEVFATPRARMIGHTAAEVFTAETARTIEENDRRALDAGGHTTFDEALVIGGRERQMVTERFPLTDYRGTVVGLCSVSRDYTRRRQLQQELIRSERLAAVGKLAAEVAHELNNPLSGILAFAEDLLEEAAPDNPSRADYEIIVREALRCRDIVRNLLEFSRPNATERRKTALADLVRKVLPIVEKQAAFHNIDFDVSAVDNLPPVDVDPHLMQQVLLNLVINARDSMNGSGTIAIRTYQADNGQQVVLSVADSGCGIPEAELREIFEPFYSTKGERGHGLGLAGVLRVVEQHGGRVDVDSKVNVGSTFRIILPMAE